MRKLFILLCFPTLCFAESFRMLTWNVYMLPKPIKFSNQKIRSEVQAQQLKEVASDLDFVVLNEAFTKRSKKNIAHALETELPHTATLPRSGGVKKVMDSGVMVLSRHPMEVIGKSYYKKCAKADCFASKGVLLVEVSLPSGSKIQIAATHMQSGGEPKSKAARMTQFDQIDELLDAHAIPGVPQILAGDLNQNADSTQEFSATLEQLKMMTIDASGPLKTTKTGETSCMKMKSRPNPKGWLDNFLLQNQGSVTTVKSKSAFNLKGMIKGLMCDLSDHLPVRAVIDVDNEILKAEAPKELPAIEQVSGEEDGKTHL